MKRPHTYFSTEFHGGPRAVRARLGNLFAAPRRSGRLLLLCTVLLVGALGGLVACDAARDGERNPFPVPDEVYAMALELAGPGGETVDLKLAFSAEAVLPGATLEAYTMEPGARPEDPEGHAFDAAFTFLVVRLERGAYWGASPSGRTRARRSMLWRTTCGLPATRTPVDGSRSSAFFPTRTPL